MDLTFSAEQDELRSVVRSFLAAKSPESAVRALMDTDRGYDEAVWKQMADQLGLQGLGIAEEHGGAGFGPVELGIVFEEMGRALLCAPFFSTVALAATALQACGDADAAAEYLPRIAAGETIATVALTEESGRWDLDAIETRADDAGALTGTKCFVLDGQVADLVLVVARCDAGPSLYAVEAGARGLTVEPLTTLDQTRKQARIRLDATPGRLIGAAGDGAAIVAATLDVAAVLLAAEQVGGAGAALDMAVEYAKVREQFGRPIGSFQAIKHKCADMLVDLEAARSAAYYAMWAAASGTADLPVAASLAKAVCSEAFTHCAAENIQVHGGIGFTWEHPAHLYFKRAKGSELLLGSPTHHRAVLADRVGL